VPEDPGSPAELLLDDSMEANDAAEPEGPAVPSVEENGSVLGGNPLTADSDFIRACRGGVPSRTPVWFMRQAGRSLPEYKALRAGRAMLDTCFDPDLVTEITLQPVRRHDVDAAVLFSDIVVPLKAAGVGVTIEPGVGPVIAAPVRDRAGVAGFPVLDPAAVAPIAAAVSQLAAELGSRPLIGFCGGPFTLASYLIEGGPSRDHAKTKAMLHGEPGLWSAFAEKLADMAITFVTEQVNAGASAVQVFDSWAGALSEADYRRFVLPHSTRIFAAIKALGVPGIHFGVGTGELLVAMVEAGPSVLGVDWRVPLDLAAARTRNSLPLQGNLDPALLFAPFEVVTHEAARILAQGRAAPGHVFNLGHGVLPETDPDVLTRLTAWVHEQS
jgi:uroporphyrinogen decarboxylase